MIRDGKLILHARKFEEPKPSDLKTRVEAGIRSSRFVLLGPTGLCDQGWRGQRDRKLHIRGDGRSNFFSAVLSQFLVPQQKARRTLLEQLTVSERRILDLIGAGKTSREIAGELFISMRTVDHHRAHIQH